MDSPIETENEEFGLNIWIAEMQSLLKNQLETFEVFKSTTRTIFGGSSLILALVSILQVFNVNVQASWYWVYVSGIILLAFLYLILIALCIRILMPVKVHGPIKADWDEIYDAFMEKSKVEILRQQLSSILNAIELNRPIV